MGRQRRDKTTPEGIGHISNPSEGGSGKETFMGLLNPSQGAKNVATPVADNSWKPQAGSFRAKHSLVYFQESPDYI